MKAIGRVASAAAALLLLAAPAGAAKEPAMKAAKDAGAPGVCYDCHETVKKLHASGKLVVVRSDSGFVPAALGAQAASADLVVVRGAVEVLLRDAVALDGRPGPAGAGPGEVDSAARGA